VTSSDRTRGSEAVGPLLQDLGRTVCQNPPAQANCPIKQAMKTALGVVWQLGCVDQAAPARGRIGPAAWLAIRHSVERHLIIGLIIQTIFLDRSGAIWTDEPSNLSRPDPSEADQARRRASVPYSEGRGVRTLLGAPVLGHPARMRCGCGTTSRDIHCGRLDGCGRAAVPAFHLGRLSLAGDIGDVGASGLGRMRWPGWLALEGSARAGWVGERPVQPQEDRPWRPRRSTGYWPAPALWSAWRSGWPPSHLAGYWPWSSPSGPGCWSRP
jgi:hypothetical protein